MNKTYLHFNVIYRASTVTLYKDIFFCYLKAMSFIKLVKQKSVLKVRKNMLYEGKICITKTRPTPS